MIVQICQLRLRLFSPNSLKEKRKILKSLISRLRNKFNISVAEIGENDLWQVATIGVSLVSGDKLFADEVMNKVIDFIDSFPDVEILECNIEIV